MGTCYLTFISLQVAVFFGHLHLSFGDCTGKGSCFVGDWDAWGPCQGTCGLNFQERSRTLCCPFTVQPRTVTNCVHFCNITGGVTERRYCIHCGNGTVDFNSVSCLCQPLYKGRCCQELVKCVDSPCVHGTCGDSTSGFVCHCEKGYRGIDCGERIEEERVQWQTVLGYFFLALLPICIVLLVIFVCMKYCPRSKKTSKKVDQRPKPVGTDNGIIREFSWEGVASNKSTSLFYNNLNTKSKSREIHWKTFDAIRDNSANLHGTVSQFNFHIENDHRYKVDSSISRGSRKQITRPPPMTRPSW